MSDEITTNPEAANVKSIDGLQKKMKLKGTVTRLELYGAFIDIGLENPAVIHISQLGNRVNRVSDALKVGDEVDVWVDKVDAERGQVTVTMVEPLAVEWNDLAEGQVYTGKAVRLENFGVFVDIGAEKEGLVHVSELSHEYVKHPSEVVRPGDEIQVKVLGYSRKKRRINLSMKALQEKPEAQLEELSMAELDFEQDEPEEMPTAMEMALRNAMGETNVAIRSKRRSQSKKERKAERRAQQEAIIARTLAYSAED